MPAPSPADALAELEQNLQWLRDAQNEMARRNLRNAYLRGVLDATPPEELTTSDPSAPVEELR